MPNDENFPMQAAMVAAMIGILSKRKRLGDEGHSLEAQVTTNTISEEELQEMKRSPRAYRRRKMREIKMLNSGKNI